MVRTPHSALASSPGPTPCVAFSLRSGDRGRQLPALGQPHYEGVERAREFGIGFNQGAPPELEAVDQGDDLVDDGDSFGSVQKA